MKSLFTFLILALIYAGSGVGVKAADVTTEKSYSIVVDAADGVDIDVIDTNVLDNICPDRVNRFDVLFEDAEKAFDVAYYSLDGIVPNLRYRHFKDWQTIHQAHKRHTYLWMNASPPYNGLGKHMLYRYRRQYIA